MSLPVIPQHALTSDHDLLRLYQRTERLWAGHIGETEQLDIGVAVTNLGLPNVHDANRLLEAALPPGQSPQEAFEEVRRHFEIRGTRCWYWQLSTARTCGAGVPPAATGTAALQSDRATSNPLADHLQSLTYRRDADDIMALTGPSGRAGEDGRVSRNILPPGVTILPARAAFRQARELAEEVCTPDAEPTLADARMLHLDDPHCDSLLAMRGGRAVGRVTVFAVGEIGRIDQVYVSTSARREGIGRMLLDRALEICARSLFKHVMLSVAPGNAPAISLYQRFGFRRIGELVNWQTP